MRLYMMAQLWIDQDVQSNRVMEAAEQHIRAAEGVKADLEPPWDGFCGLVRICDDEALKERGVIRASLAQHMAHAVADSQGLGAVSATAAQAHQQGMPAAAVGAGPPTQSMGTAAGPATTLPAAPDSTAAARTSAVSHQHAGRPQPSEPASAAPALDDQEQEGDIPMWVVDYVIAASTSSEGGSEAGGSKSDGSRGVDAVLADLLSSDANNSDDGDDGEESGSTDDWVDDLPIPPTHTAVKPA